MKIIFILLTIILLPIEILSQECLNAKNYGGKSSDYLLGMTQDINSNIYIAGFSDSKQFGCSNGISVENNSNRIAYLSKLNHDGECIWVEKIVGDHIQKINDIVVDNLGNIFVTGNFTSFRIDFNNGIYLENFTTVIPKMNDIFLAKYNSDGICQWAELISGNDNNYVDALQIDFEGNVYLGGHSTIGDIYFNNGKIFTNIKIPSTYLAKYDTDGTCQWAHLFWNGLSVNDIAVDNDLNIYITGNFSNDGISIDFDGKRKHIQPVNTIFKIDSFVAKFDKNSKAQWAFRLGGTNDDSAKSIAVDGNGDIVVSGEFNSMLFEFNNGKKIEKSGLFESFSTFLAKFNSSGDCQWARLMAFSYNASSAGLAIDKQNSIYVTGTYEGTISFGKGINFDLSKRSDAYIAKYNSFGKIVWAERIGGDDREFGTHILVESDSNIVCGGEFSSKKLEFDNDKSLENIYTSTIPYKDIYILRYSNHYAPRGIQANTIDSVSHFSRDMYESISKVSSTLFSKRSLLDDSQFSFFSIYPNPSSDFITIQLSNKGLQPFAKDVKVQIFDMLGIEVISESIHPITSSHRMNIEKLPAGMYFIRIGSQVEKFAKM